MLEEKIVALTKTIVELNAAIVMLTESIEELTKTRESGGKPIARTVAVKAPSAKAPAVKAPVAREVTPDPTPTPPKTNALDSDDFLNEPDAPIVTVDEVRAIAQEIIANGVERIIIKEMIKNIGAESMADMTQEQLVQLKEKLEDYK